MSRIEALFWKYNYTDGIVVRGEEITEWPESLGPRPTKEVWDQAVEEYDAELQEERQLQAVLPPMHKLSRLIFKDYLRRKKAGESFDAEIEQVLNRMEAIENKDGKRK